MSERGQGGPPTGCTYRGPDADTGLTNFHVTIDIYAAPRYAGPMLKYILLGFLQYDPQTGYELTQILAESTMNFWHAYHSQIYTTLRKLEEQGLVESETDAAESGLSRRVYTITAAGRADLEGWLALPMMEADQMKQTFLVRIFFSGTRDIEDVKHELRIQRDLHQQKLAEYQNTIPAFIQESAGGRAELADHMRFWAATLRFGVLFEETYLRWLDETLAALTDFEV
jgi:PadR family transcriptional regulator, regulatory protein AphA